MASRLIHALAPFGAAVLLASCALVSCVRDGAGRQPSADAAVTVKVARVGFDQDAGEHYVMLLDRRGARGLEIMIGPEEARSIQFELNGVKPQRPLADDLLRAIVERTGVHVTRVEITSVRDATYHAAIQLDGQQRPIDSRPSDAIALALGVGAPIYVAARLMRPQVADAAPATVRAAGLTVQELTPDLASYFAVVPNHGVLIADFAAVGAQSGLRRGDIVTAIDGRPIHTLDDFAHAAAQAKSPLVLTVYRDGRALSITLAPSAATAAAH